IKTNYIALHDQSVNLPCNTTIPSAEDAISLIFWYKGDQTGAPIYSVDARHSNDIKKAKHFQMETTKSQLSFNITVPISYLTISKLKEKDSGEYRCRVDFRRARTINTIVYLEIIVNPRKVIIKDDKENILNRIAGPYNENDNLKLYCIVFGGNFSFTESSIVNPVTVKITSIKRPLSANKQINLNCKSMGSHPPAQISWFLGNLQLHNTSESHLKDDIETNSVLKFVPSSHHNGAYLICKAENIKLVNSSIYDTWKLNIYYKPKVKLVAQSNIKLGIVKERNEVILECKIDSNPMISKIGWIFNDNPLESDLKTGLIIQNSTLVIKFAQKQHTGNYSCYAVNIEGKSFSNNLRIIVNYAPICKEKQQSIYGAAIGELTKIICNVDAEPEDVVFFWQLNNTQIDSRRFYFSNEPKRSVLHFKPTKPIDYGKLNCWAKNSVGGQEEPCTFNVIPASRPRPLHDCLVTNQTWNSILVRCTPGFDGGMKQTFHLQVFDAKHERLLFNVTRKDNPHFNINSLASGAEYILELYSSNAKGASEIVTINAQTVAMLRQSSGTIWSRIDMISGENKEPDVVPSRSTADNEIKLNATYNISMADCEHFSSDRKENYRNEYLLQNAKSIDDTLVTSSAVNSLYSDNYSTFNEEENDDEYGFLQLKTAQNMK
ncbi:hemicentin-2-like protein, partial [Dinothrombium tinctorium]